MTGSGNKTAKTIGSLIVLLVGWLSPQYAAKLCDPALNTFLKESPVLAAVLVQAAWVPLLLVPARDPSRNRGVAELMGWPLLFACLVTCIHTCWYKSFSLTNVATNTVLWNTDTVTTIMIAVAFSRSAPSRNAIIGALLSLVGAVLAVGFSAQGDTLMGCALCLSASLGFALYAVLVERLWDTSPVQLMALEGLLAAVVLLVAVGIAAALAPSQLRGWFAYAPPPGWLVFITLNCLMLNLGWLWCTELVGATWTAMVACLSIPASTVLDVCLLDIYPSLAGLVGGCLIVLGFAVTTWTERPGETAETVERFGRCKRWLGWDDVRATPFLQGAATPDPSCESESTNPGSEDADRYYESNTDTTSSSDGAPISDSVQHPTVEPPV